MKEAAHEGAAEPDRTGGRRLAVFERGDPAGTHRRCWCTATRTPTGSGTSAADLADDHHVVALRRARRGGVLGAPRRTAPGTARTARGRPLRGGRAGQPGPPGAPGRARLGLAAVLGGRHRARRRAPTRLLHHDVRARAWTTWATGSGTGCAGRPPAHLRQLLVQGAHSWYITAFHLPFLAPATWRLGLARAWPRVLRDLEAVRPRAGHPQPTLRQDAVRGIELYRANMRPTLRHPRERPTEVPVQLVTLRRDHYVSPFLSEGLERWVPRLTRRELHATHWSALLEQGPVVAGLVAGVRRADRGDRASAGPG